jgi:hypothetical protein
LDHVLFVIGLVLLDPRWRPALWQVSAFTLAHTITLALGALGLLRVPSGMVEPLIALSIVYLCVENVLVSKPPAWRPAIVFAFGLLHGFGLAFALEAYGLPEGQVVPGLLAFALGVEIGQLAVIAACVLLAGVWFRRRDGSHRAVTVPVSLAIAAIGAYWALARFGLVPGVLLSG